MNDDCLDVCDVTLKDVDENNPHKKQTKTNKLKNKARTVHYQDWWGAADQCTMSHGTYIHIMI